MTNHHEIALLSCCYLDKDCIDRAIQCGIGEAHFIRLDFKHQWRVMVDLRVAGAPTDIEAVITAAKKQGVLGACGDLAGIMEASGYTPTTLNFTAIVEAMNDSHARRMLAYRVAQVGDLLKSDAPLSQVSQVVEQMGECMSLGASPNRTTKEISQLVRERAEAQIQGFKEPGQVVLTGLASFDKYATPIMPHEYVVVAGRTSHGKSSLMTQMAIANLKRGLKVAYYTIETSSEAVLRQMASQWSQTNARFIRDETPEKQHAFMDEVKYMDTCNRLMIFDNVLTLESILAHGRMLAVSFQPDVVFLDYLNIIGVSSDGQYEKMTKVSKAMIPFRKSLGCALVAAAQLNRGPEKDERRPQRTDLRDSGSLEEDAHRLIAIWRKPGQALDHTHFESEILQLKLRDGPVAGIRAMFQANITRFFEQANEQTS